VSKNWRQVYCFLVAKREMEMRNALKIKAENSKDSGHLNNLDMDGRVTLKWILMKEVVSVLAGLIWLRTGDQWLAIVITATSSWPADLQLAFKGWSFGDAPSTDDVTFRPSC
jgi:hypothetical protein